VDHAKGVADAGGVQVVVMARGAIAYTERHLRALRRWVGAAALRPRRAVLFQYEGSSSGAGLRVVWPLGIVVRDLARVYLAGVPAEAESARDVRTYGLERIALHDSQSALEVASVADSGSPPAGLDEVHIRDGLDVPFSVFPPNEGDLVHLEARFCREQARHIDGRIWHSRQKVTRHRDGTLTIAFGPCNRGEAEAWLRQWGDSVVSSKLKAR